MRMVKRGWGAGQARRMVLGLALIMLVTGGISPVAAFVAGAFQAEAYAEVVAPKGEVFSCPRSVGCATVATAGARVYAKGEARTGATGTMDLQSRTTVFRLQNRATLQFEEVTNAIQRMLLKAGRLFVSHDPQGRDIIVVEAGSKRVEAVDTQFTLVVTDSARLSEAEVFVAVPEGGGSVTINIRGLDPLRVAGGQQVTLPAEPAALPPPQPLDPAEQQLWEQTVNEWQQTPGLILPPVPQAVPQTGFRIADKFVTYWQAHDGPNLIGYPISNEFYAPGQIGAAAPDRARFALSLQVAPPAVAAQCFERALLEYHPEYQGTAYEILIAQLGTYGYHQRYGAVGAPGQVPNQEAGNAHYFSETGHWVGGRFWQYWQQTGGLAQHGYPLSDEFEEPSALDPGQRYRVQYFERSVFEYHPEQENPSYAVTQAQLGTYYCKALYPTTPTVTATATGTAPATATRTGTPAVTLTATPTVPGTPTGTPTPRIPTITKSPTPTWTPTITRTPTRTPTDTPTPLYSPTVTRTPAPAPAQVCVSLRQDPDLAVAPGGVFTYTVDVVNIGPGRAGSTGVRIALDPNVEVLDFRSASPSIFVDYVGVDAVSVRFHTLLPGQNGSAQIIARVRPGAASGLRITSRALAFWDDLRPHHTQRSNAITFAVGPTTDSGAHGLQPPLAVAPAGPVAAGTMLQLAGDFFADEEWVSFWLNQPGGTVLAVSARGRADQDGLLTFRLNTTGLAPGLYSVVAHGACTGVEGIGVFTVR